MLAWKAGALRAMAIPITSDVANSVHSGGVGSDEPGQHDPENQLQQLHHDEVPAAREAVGEDAGGDRQHQKRTELGEHEEPDERSRLSALLDIRRQREVFHPRADVGGEQTEPDRAGSPGRRAPPGPYRACASGGGSPVRLADRRPERRWASGGERTMPRLIYRRRHEAPGPVPKTPDDGRPDGVAAERYANAKAAMFLRDGEWAEPTYGELSEQVRALALG